MQHWRDDISNMYVYACVEEEEKAGFECGIEIDGTARLEKTGLFSSQGTLHSSDNGRTNGGAFGWVKSQRR